MVTLSPQKQDRINRVADDRGIIAAAAMDQRGSLKKAIAQHKGMEKNEVSDQMMEEFKSAVARVLTPHASAILLDPQWGVPAMGQRSANAGLLANIDPITNR